MICPLLYLSAFSLLAGAAAQQTFNVSSEFNISSCPITFYGQQYEQIYVNFRSDNFAVCFNNFFDPQTGGDCLVGPPLTLDESGFEILQHDSSTEANFHRALPTITTQLKCTVNLLFQYNGIEAGLVLGNFGTQAAVYLNTENPDSTVFDVQLNGNTVDTLNVTNTPDVQQLFSYLDLSGCRNSGVLYKPDTVLSSDPGTCSNLTCDHTAVLRTTGCGPLEYCEGNNICLKDTIITCTVTGPTVIDFYGQVNSVQDRCAYSLMSTPLVPGLHILGNFQERRRKDVSFLDSVTLQLDGPGVLIHLEQGEKVQLDDTTLTLSHSAQVVYGVELSKNHAGVTATVSHSNYTASVFFDGYTAQISLIGPGGEQPSPNGLCSNFSGSLSDLRLSEYSASGCEIQYDDTADSTINCTLATEHCNLLKEAPFTSCNSIIDPEPYITACTNILCNYPAVDGLNCQLLEVYDRACSLQDNDITDSWRSTLGCPPPEPLCDERICGAHEFCGERFVGGETGCFCRALFASKYTSTNTLGDPTVCGPDSASLTLVGCLLEENGIDYSTLHLNDQTCRGQMDEQTHMVTFSFNNSNTCGTVVTANDSQIIYKNTIMTQNSSSAVINRQDKVQIDFFCVQTQPDVQSMSFRIKDSSVTLQITSGNWNYTLTMNAYTDPARTQVLESSTEVQLDQRIWVELETDGLDSNMVAVVTESCWATSEPSANESLRYDLIMNGCANPADKTVKVNGNGLGTSNYFSFDMFQFSGKSGDVYLHCKLQLCVTENNRCAPVCKRGVRRQRAARPTYEGEGAFITMAWIN